MKGGTLIRSANNQILDEFEAVIIQPPVLRELRVDFARPTFRALRRSCDHALREDS